MTNEIEEILDRLKRIDHIEYSGGFEFADSSNFNEMARCFNERKKMADYITNLQEEIIDLKDTIQNKNDCIGCYDCIIEDRDKRIDKAIEYLKSISMDKTPDYIPLKDYKEYHILLNILRGDE